MALNNTYKYIEVRIQSIASLPPHPIIASHTRTVENHRVKEVKGKVKGNVPLEVRLIVIGSEYADQIHNQ